MTFTKMQGAGNDYVYVDCTTTMIENPNELSQKISDRHFGVGADGLVLICHSAVADFKMRMFNADGSEAQMCGNASRCIGKFVYEKGLTKKTELSLETLAGIKLLSLHVKDEKVDTVTVDMGEPELLPTKIPVNFEGDRALNIPLQVGKATYAATCVSMGNPHAVIFVDNVANFDVHGVGKIIEHLPIFPQRVNVEFVEKISDVELQMRVWERGSGETWACGTGACATLVAAAILGYTRRCATIHLLGGDLYIEWRESNNRIYMTGGAVTVFDGEYYG